MRDRTQQYPGPEGLDAVPMIELVSALEGHLGDLERARAATGEARPPARTRAAAVHALTIITALLGRLADLASPLTRTAMEHGATPADIAGALGQDEPDLDHPVVETDHRAADVGREPAPRDAADMHPARHTGSVTAPVGDQPAGTGRDHGRLRLRVVADHHVVEPPVPDPAPADDPGMVLDLARVKVARAILEDHAAPFLADEPFAVRRDFGEALVVVIQPGARLVAEQVADELYRCSSIEVQPEDVAAALQRAAQSRP